MTQQDAQPKCEQGDHWASPRSGTAASNFSWSIFEYRVGTGQKAKKILTSISGSLNGGEVCALIGPSGAGKTSLLNILAARIRSKGAKQQVSGSIRLDGDPIEGPKLRKRIAYVMQEDLLCPTHTPREALLFSAKLRLPTSVKLPEKKELVNKMLSDLGLLKCADTYIGNEMIRGISGGEKKRTSVGIELIMRPKLVFLDEPTSGLDAYAAHSVINKLRDLTSSIGCNILCTIHQPSSEVFHTFNKVMILREGQRFFFGSIQDLSQSLTRFGHGCPNEFNLADHVMFLVQTAEEDVLADLQGKLNPATEEEEEVPTRRDSIASVNTEQTAGFFTQLVELSKREAGGIWRNKPGLIASVFIPIMLNVFFGLIFYEVGDTEEDDYSPMSHFGGLTQVAIGGMFLAAQPLLLRFPLDRGIFLREFSTNTYGGAAYFFSKTAVELPQSFLIACIVWTVVYWFMGMQGNFFVYVVVFWATGIAAASTALLVGCIAANPEVAQQAAPAIFVPQLLFAGFFIRLEQVPVFLRWIQYICSLKYGMNLYILNEFGEATRKDWSTGARMAAEEFINQNDIEPDSWWLYVAILLSIIVVIRLLAMAALTRRAASFF